MSGWPGTGRLIDSMSVSLDGFVEAADGSLDWVLVDEEPHAGVVLLRYAVAGP